MGQRRLYTMSEGKMWVAWLSICASATIAIGAVAYFFSS